MCLAIPMKIIEIKGETAIVEGDNHLHEVNLALIKNAEAGDYVLAHGNIAIHKVAPEEAEKIIKLTDELANSSNIKKNHA